MKRPLWKHSGKGINVNNQERHENVSWHCDITEIKLKGA